MVDHHGPMQQDGPQPQLKGIIGMPTSSRICLVFLNAALVVLGSKAFAQDVPAGDVTHVIPPESILVLPVETLDVASLAELEIELRVDSVLTSASEVELEIIIHNKGSHEFRVPETLALPPGDLELWWNPPSGAAQTRRLRLGPGVRDGGSSWPRGFVYLPPKSSYIRRVTLSFQKGLHRIRRRWPPGKYEFWVRMGFSPEYEAYSSALPAHSVPRGIFQSESVFVRIVE